MKYLVDKHNLIFVFKSSVLLMCGFVLSRFYFWPALIITNLLLVFFICQYINLKEQSIADVLKHLKAINRGEESLNIEAYQEGEISKLATELNKTTIKMASMNQLLSKQTANMKKGLEDIAHQLKTPLSSLLLLNELQKKDEISLRSRDQLLRMDYLIGSLLKLIKLEAQLETFVLQENKLQEIVEDSVKMIRPLNDKLIINIIVSDELCLCDFNKTREAIVNVLNNKLRYAKNEITIISYCKDLCLYLEISDDIQKMFFYELLLTVLKPWLLGVTLGNVINFLIFKVTAKVSELPVMNYKFPLKTSLFTLVLIILIAIVHYVVVKAENNKTNLIKAIRSY